MIRTFLGASAALLLSAIPAAAQEQPEQPAPDENHIIVNVGAGPQVIPQFPGADGYSITPLLTGSIRRAGEPLPATAPDDGIGISLIGTHSAIEFGPVVQFQNKRKAEDVGAAVGDVGFTVEAGGFINLKIGDHFRIRAEARQGIGGHESLLGDVGFDFIGRPGENTVITIGPRLKLADSQYMRTYFGVTPSVATATGLAAYDPDGGVRAVGGIAGITHQLSRSFGVYAYAGYDRLVGDAADSPIVRAYGSRDQFSGGIALYYSFRMRNPF